MKRRAEKKMKAVRAWTLVSDEGKMWRHIFDKRKHIAPGFDGNWRIARVEIREVTKK